MRLQRLVSCFLFAVLLGCGGKSTTACKINTLNVFPATATADHTAAPPGNMQRFDAFVGSTTGDCVVAQSNLTNATWSVSDPVNVSITNPPDPTFGTATCKAATAGAVTVTATLTSADGSTASGTASLTCK